MTDIEFDDGAAERLIAAADAGTSTGQGDKVTRPVAGEEAW
ncbi:hypothetical protein [Curtobacterium sp. MCSS17_008]|nr:hypothetical protein [Curtobacterium sp. MCSS17_008]